MLLSLQNRELSTSGDVVVTPEARIVYFRWCCCHSRTENCLLQLMLLSLQTLYLSTSGDVGVTPEPRIVYFRWCYCHSRTENCLLQVMLLSLQNLELSASGDVVVTPESRSVYCRWCCQTTSPEVDKCRVWSDNNISWSRQFSVLEWQQHHLK
jgi:hypothetical protein